MAQNQPYRFPGVTDFIAREGVRPSFAAKIQGTFLLARVVDALSQIPETDPAHRAAMYREARDGIAALKATLDTAVAAFDHVMTHCPPPPSEDDPVVPAADPITATRSAARGAAKADPIPADPEPAKAPAKGGK